MENDRFNLPSPAGEGGAALRVSECVLSESCAKVARKQKEPRRGSVSRDEASANIGLDPRRKRSAFGPPLRDGATGFRPPVRYRQ